VSCRSGTFLSSGIFRVAQLGQSLHGPLVLLCFASVMVRVNLLRASPAARMYHLLADSISCFTPIPISV
jgi:hypothetical protein